MQVEAVPLTEFVHDRITAHEGRPLMMDEYTAGELERAGLVRINIVPRRGDQALALRSGAAFVGAEAGKAQDDGRGPLSSALPAAPASPTSTLRASKPGGGKHRKIGT
jgi:hypothetical protein